MNARGTFGRVAGLVVGAAMALAACALPARAQQQAVLDTFPDGAAGPALLPLTTSRVAIGFTTPNSLPARALTSIVLGYYGVASGEITLCTDSGGNPGTPLATIPLPNSSSDPSCVTRTIPFTPSITLDPNRVYWLIIGRITQVGSVNVCFAANPAVVPASRILAPGAGWQPATNFRPAIRVLLEPSASACCNSTAAACTLMPASVCTSLGLSAIPGGVCTPAACQASGACCRGAACTFTIQSSCVQGATPGVWLGANITCAPMGRGGSFNACCPADVDGTPGLGVEDIFRYLNAWFAGCA